MHPSPMPKPPKPGQTVRWRDLRHARALCWEEAYGPGPFKVLAVTDKSHLGIPAGIVLQTVAGECEINEVWLTVEESCWEESESLPRPDESLLIAFGAF
jgi:hypothetical protein